ncbi:MAG: 4Fe-4S dicluster domain-containing protein [Thermoanaerobaculales bacterium]|nr:4Fe-4S dicluster domain-containing protein [Thermoanaerobaculales bacterium]
MTAAPKALLVDITRCIGCGACSQACKTANQLPAPVEPKLTADTWTVVLERGDGRFVRDLCRHCLEPSCVSVCPVGALTKSDDGPVVYDKSICLGCRYCMIGCPFRVPMFEWHSATPRIRKCILCAPRLERGLPTACAEACPTEATVFGDRDTLVAVARARLAAHPERYHDHVYGLTEVGGTSVLFLSPVPFEELDFDTTVADFPLPDLTWRLLLHVPNVVLLGAGFLGASYWLYRRRDQVAADEGPDRAPSTHAGPGADDG